MRAAEVAGLAMLPAPDTYGPFGYWPWWVLGASALLLVIALYAFSWLWTRPRGILTPPPGVPVDRVDPVQQLGVDPGLLALGGGVGDQAVPVVGEEVEQVTPIGPDGVVREVPVPEEVLHVVVQRLLQLGGQILRRGGLHPTTLRCRRLGV